jgi:hypothetical protein
MKIIVLSIFTLGALGLFGTVSAEPVKLSKEQMASVTAGTITPGSQTNGGGNEPKGQANGVPTTPATNPQGKAPAGQNK